MVNLIRFLGWFFAIMWLIVVWVGVDSVLIFLAIYKHNLLFLVLFLIILFIPFQLFSTILTLTDFIEGGKK